jgi:hypothetical protein
VRNWVALRDVFNGKTPEGAKVSAVPGQLSVEFPNGEHFIFHIVSGNNG